MLTAAQILSHRVVHDRGEARLVQVLRLERTAHVVERVRLRDQDAEDERLGGRVAPVVDDKVGRQPVERHGSAVAVGELDTARPRREARLVRNHGVVVAQEAATADLVVRPVVVELALQRAERKQVQRDAALVGREAVERQGRGADQVATLVRAEELQTLAAARDRALQVQHALRVDRVGVTVRQVVTTANQRLMDDQVPLHPLPAVAEVLRQALALGAEGRDCLALDGTRHALAPAAVGLVGAELADVPHPRHEGRLVGVVLVVQVLLDRGHAVELPDLSLESLDRDLAVIAARETEHELVEPIGELVVLPTTLVQHARVPGAPHQVPPDVGLGLLGRHRHGIKQPRSHAKLGVIALARQADQRVDRRVGHELEERARPRAVALQQSQHVVLVYRQLLAEKRLLDEVNGLSERLPCPLAAVGELAVRLALARAVLVAAELVVCEVEDRVHHGAVAADLSGRDLLRAVGNVRLLLAAEVLGHELEPALLLAASAGTQTEVLARHLADGEVHAELEAGRAQERVHWGRRVDLDERRSSAGAPILARLRQVLDLLDAGGDRCISVDDPCVDLLLDLDLVCQHLLQDGAIVASAVAQHPGRRVRDQRRVAGNTEEVREDQHLRLDTLVHALRVDGLGRRLDHALTDEVERVDQVLDLVGRVRLRGVDRAAGLRVPKRLEQPEHLGALQRLAEGHAVRRGGGLPRGVDGAGQLLRGSHVDLRRLARDAGGGSLLEALQLALHQVVDQEPEVLESRLAELLHDVTELRADLLQQHALRLRVAGAEVLLQRREDRLEPLVAVEDAAEASIDPTDGRLGVAGHQARWALVDRLAELLQRPLLVVHRADGDRAVDRDEVGTGAEVREARVVQHQAGALAELVAVEVATERLQDSVPDLEAGVVPEAGELRVDLRHQRLERAARRERVTAEHERRGAGTGQLLVVRERRPLRAGRGGLHRVPLAQHRVHVVDHDAAARLVGETRVAASRTAELVEERVSRLDGLVEALLQRGVGLRLSGEAQAGTVVADHLHDAAEAGDRRVRGDRGVLRLRDAEHPIGQRGAILQETRLAGEAGLRDAALDGGELRDHAQLLVGRQVRLAGGDRLRRLRVAQDARPALQVGLAGPLLVCERLLAGAQADRVTEVADDAVLAGVLPGGGDAHAGTERRTGQEALADRVPVHVGRVADGLEHRLGGLLVTLADSVHQHTAHRVTTRREVQRRLVVVIRADRAALDAAAGGATGHHACRQAGRELARGEEPEAHAARALDRLARAVSRVAPAANADPLRVAGAESEGILGRLEESARCQHLDRVEPDRADAGEAAPRVEAAIVVQEDVVEVAAAVIERAAAGADQLPALARDAAAHDGLERVATRLRAERADRVRNDGGEVGDVPPAVPEALTGLRVDGVPPGVTSTDAACGGCVVEIVDQVADRHQVLHADLAGTRETREALAQRAETLLRREVRLLRDLRDRVGDLVLVQPGGDTADRATHDGAHRGTDDRHDGADARARQRAAAGTGRDVADLERGVTLDLVAGLIDLRLERAGSRAAGGELAALLANALDLAGQLLRGLLRREHFLVQREPAHQPVGVLPVEALSVVDVALVDAVVVDRAERLLRVRLVGGVGGDDAGEVLAGVELVEGAGGCRLVALLEHLLVERRVPPVLDVLDVAAGPPGDAATGATGRCDLAAVVAQHRAPVAGLPANLRRLLLVPAGAGHLPTTLSEPIAPVVCQRSLPECSSRSQS